MVGPELMRTGSAAERRRRGIGSDAGSAPTRGGTRR